MVKVPRFLGDVLTKLLNWRGRVPSVPHPAFDTQGNDVLKVAHGHQRCQFVKTVGVAEAWGLATNFFGGLAKLCALKHTKPKVYVYPPILVTFLKKTKS